MADEQTADLNALTADIVAAHVANNDLQVSELPGLIQAVYSALAGLGAPSVAEPEPKKPAVSIRASIKPDYLVCLEDGKKVTMLKRYLGVRYNLTPAEYRAKWGLPADYPMVAPNYAERRRELAKVIGLGSRPRKPESGVSTAKAAPKKSVASKGSAPAATPAGRRTLKVKTDA